MSNNPSPIPTHPGPATGEVTPASLHSAISGGKLDVGRREDFFLFFFFQFSPDFWGKIGK